MLDTTFKLVRYTDESRVELDGSTKSVRLVIFYLGRFGPFTERFDRDGFSEQQLLERAGAIRRQLETLHV